jgi:hypothetical protein
MPLVSVILPVPPASGVSVVDAPPLEPVPVVPLIVSVEEAPGVSVVDAPLLEPVPVVPLIVSVEEAPGVSVVDAPPLEPVLVSVADGVSVVDPVPVPDVLVAEVEGDVVVVAGAQPAINVADNNNAAAPTAHVLGPGMAIRFRDCFESITPYSFNGLRKRIAIHGNLTTTAMQTLFCGFSGANGYVSR